MTTKPAPLFVALAAGAIAFAIAFVYPAITPEPVAWYYPLQHAWAYEVRPSGVAADLYGRTAQALVAWAVVTAAALVLARRRPQIHARTIALVAGWALTATVFAMLFYAWTLHYRVPVPAPLPPPGAPTGTDSRGAPPPAPPAPPPP